MDRFEGHEDAGEHVAGVADSQSGISLKAIEHRVRNLVALAHRLERIEAGTAPVCADCYQALFRNLTQALSQDLPGPTIQTLLNTHPAAAELYENMHYARAGLSHAPPAGAMASQTLAVLWLARVGGACGIAHAQAVSDHRTARVTRPARSGVPADFS